LTLELDFDIINIQTSHKYINIQFGAFVLSSSSISIFVTDFIKISTYYRFLSPTQTVEDIEKQIESLEIWGQPAQNFYQSNIPKVKAFVGNLPPGQKGIEFTTDVSPDPNTPPYLATESW
jgi:hypothetical protein